MPWRICKVECHLEKFLLVHYGRNGIVDLNYPHDPEENQNNVIFENIANKHYISTKDKELVYVS